MAEPPDKTPAKKPFDPDDAWPNTMRHYKWEKQPPETDEPETDEPETDEPRADEAPGGEEPQADGEP
jgi:hypothetical protein